MNDTFVTLTGWVGTTVTLKDVAGGHQVANFRVASTSRRLRGNEWVDGPTTWYQVKAWRGLAEHVTQSLRVGDPVVVHGRLEADVWTREDGSVSTQLVVTASSVGHDLARCTSSCRRPRREGGARQEEVAATEVHDPWAADRTDEDPATRSAQAAEGSEDRQAGSDAA